MNLTWTLGSLTDLANQWLVSMRKSFCCMTCYIEHLTIVKNGAIHC